MGYSPAQSQWGMKVYRGSLLKMRYSYWWPLLERGESQIITTCNWGWDGIAKFILQLSVFLLEASSKATIARFCASPRTNCTSKWPIFFLKVSCVNRKKHPQSWWPVNFEAIPTKIYHPPTTKNRSASMSHTVFVRLYLPTNLDREEFVAKETPPLTSRTREAESFFQVSSPL